MHPPPLYASKSTSPTCQIYKEIETKTINTSNCASDSNNTLLLTPTTFSDEKQSSSNSSLLEAMVLNNTDSNQSNNSNKRNNLNEYWIATNVCSSYQQVGGTRYRLTNAHRFWFIDQLNEIYYRRYQLRNCAFELFFNDETSWLFSFFDMECRNKVFNAIIALEPTNLIESVEFFQNPKTAIKTSQIHYKWCRREISNFEYLMRLNTLAGRTFNDLTQYPVVPWVITDFISETLDLTNKQIYRDLSKPIGALDAESLEKTMERYDSLKEDDDENCFMYGTHYSSIGYVLYYLLRMQPFTTYNLKFQDGKFDCADRLFHSICDTFKGCLKNSGDVKELIPEFYYLTDFLCNKENLDLGKRDYDNVIVSDVLLPAWANNSSEIFIKTMRDALESEYVSSNLHNWIDLIFGYKQQGIKAEEAFNVFHPYTYEGNVDIDKINDETQKNAILSQIDEYGQTPLQLFNDAHPQRFKQSEVLTTIFKSKKVRCYSCNSLTDNENIGIVSISSNIINKNVICVGNDYCLDIHNWNANKMSIEKQKSLSINISKLLSFGKSKKQNKIGNDVSEKIYNGNSCFATTKDGLFTFVCGFKDCSFVIWDVRNSKMIKTIVKHEDIVSCLALDENTEKQKAILVTGSYDQSVIVWRLNMKSSTDNIKYLVDIEPIHHLVNQLSGIQCVDISLKSGIIACCSLDGIVNIYNSSTGDHYHMLQPFVDKCMKLRKENELKKQKELHGKEKEEKKEDDDSESSSANMKPLKNGIECSALTTVRVSDVFGYILCYSNQTKDLFLYSSNGKMMNYSSSNDDVFNDIQFSKSGNYIVCGGKNCVIRIKELPSFKTKKKFKEAKVYKQSITSIYLSKNETFLFVGTANGNVFVYSLPQKEFVEVRIGALGRHGF